MARRTHPRSDRSHELVAGEILHRHSQRTGRPIELPVPIEMIVEDTYGLEVVYDDLAEPSDTMIFGALVPAERRIVITSNTSAFSPTSSVRSGSPSPMSSPTVSRSPQASE